MLIYKNKNLIVGSLLVMLLLILKYPILNTPHFWDATLWIKSAYWTLNNNFNPVLPFPLENGGLDTGHPPLVFLSLALAFYLFGNSLITAHLVMLLFAAITIIFTYLLASYLYNEKVGIISVIFLLFSPLFFAQTGIVSLDLPLAAFTISTIYFALRNNINNIIGYLISGTLLVLSKEPGVLTIIAILVYIFIKNYKESKQELIKKCFIHSIPIIIFAFWIYYHAINQPIYNAISGSSEFWRPITPIIFFRFLNRLKFLFLENFHWVLTLIILIALSNTKKLIKITRKRLLISVLITLLLIFSFKALINILLNNLTQLTNLLSLNTAAYFITEKNVQGILYELQSFIYILGVFILIIILVYNKLSFRLFKDIRLIPIFLTILFYLGLFSWTFNAPRYFLPIYPLFFIISSYSLVKLMKNKFIYLTFAIILILFISGWVSVNEEPRGWVLEKNMNYLDSIETHKLVVEYIEKNFPDATILTSYFLTEELRFPFLGYINKPINPIEFSHYNYSGDYKKIPALQNGDWHYYQCYSKKICDLSSFTPTKTGNISDYDPRYKDYLTPEDFDIFYNSPQSTIGGRSTIPEDFNLILIKRFEKNGRYAEIYATPEFLSRNKLL